MKKILTLDHQRITAFGEFEKKFSDYLEYLRVENSSYYKLLSGQFDFIIIRDEMKEDFNIFFSKWLKLKYEYNEPMNKDGLARLIQSVSQIDDNFDQFLSYYNFFYQIK